MNMGRKRDNIIARVRDIVRQPLAAAAALFAEARIIELPELGVERSVAQAVVDALRGKTIINEATGICARLSSSARGKLVSNKATGKSKANGFSQQQHNAIVARIAEVYEAAVLIASRPDREGDANILSIKRFAAKVKFGRQLAAAWITVKESKLHGHHIYSVEAIKLEALDRIVEVVSGNTPHASSAPTRSIVAFFSSCVNAVFGKISTHRSLLAAAAALLLLAPLSLFAAPQSFTWRGQTFTYSGAELKWSDPAHPEADDSEPILVFKELYDPANPGETTCSLNAPAAFTVDFLAIAGGGAGGTIQSSSYSTQCAGGGGAGELLQRFGITLPADLYSIYVGQGAPADGVTSAKSQGKDGSDSYIFDSIGTEILRVFGGGGGGGASAGRPGGSGGGAAGRNATAGATVKANDDGKGYAGGRGSTSTSSANYYHYGAGGGGAGAAGGNVGTSAAATAGGKGVAVNITGGELWFDVPESERSKYIDGSTVWCAGGGGGGTTTSGKNGGAGGKGGGGKGGTYADTDAGAPVAGTPYTGSGGGAGGRTKVGAAGGCGVVIIRITAVESKSEIKTFTWQGKTITYSGAELAWSDPAKAGTDEAEPILVYKTSGIFLPPVEAKARILAIGGGGAGGTVVASTYGNHSGGGGGGAGELVDRSEVPFGGSKTNFITVGAGGLRQGSSLRAMPGGNGRETFITVAGETEPYLLVKGGGGGGGESDGMSGGSGGGGTVTNSTVATSGGVSVRNETDGKGNDGGKAVSSYAGGGGGAGGKGEDAQTSPTSSHGGNGGVGFESDIDPNNIRKYAGGGGGGKTSSIGDPGEGGEGGGGRGGKDLNTDESIAIAGEANTGSGGGGGGTHKPGAAGGSGIVIIRITSLTKDLLWTAIEVEAGGNKGTIFVGSEDGTEAETNWLGKDFVVSYTAVQGGLSFVLNDDMKLIPEQEEQRAKYTVKTPVWANARILAVGGGGGGGFINTAGDGAGAGGGAGGFVEGGNDGSIVFDTNGVYSISVGRGGAAGDRNGASGKIGGASSVTKAGSNVIPVALGGGGGGAWSDGVDGASGGGGSRSPNAESGKYERMGGQGLQGHKGGDATTGFNVGAGGGGAGGDGGDAILNGVYLPGTGGSGLESDITGEKLFYAAGGGGAYINAKLSDNRDGGAGGSEDAKAGRAVGGHGAGVVNGVARAAENGMDGRGGGGGGGTSHDGADPKEFPAGAGGSGVVIIRLSNFVVKNVPLPVPSYWPGNPFVYDGNAHTGVVKALAYTLTGTPVATNADVYSVTATISGDAPYEWADGGRGDRTVTWEINQMRVPQPVAVSSLVYNGKEQYPVDKAGLHLDDDGYCYTDAGHKYCFLTEAHKATDADEYHFAAQLVKVDPQGNFATNFVWTTSSMDDKAYTWEITQAPNKIVWTSPYLGYLLSRLDTPAKDHYPTKHVTSDWGLGGAKVEYRAGEGEGWKDWPPPEKGNYSLRITITETTNWKGDSVTADFGTWNRLADLYTDQMVVTVGGYQSGTTVLEDFPVPVRVHEPTKDGYSEFSGFSYGRAGATGTELHFFDKNGDPVEHEVDAWNTRGESILWVRVPSLANKTTTLTMCWRRTGDIRIPAYDPAGVWKKFVGVWHMSKMENGKLTDVSGNGRDAYLANGAKAEFVDGPMGKAVRLKGGDLIADNWPYPAGTTSNRWFTYTGWYRYPDFVKDDKVTGGKKMFAGVKLGASTTAEMKSMSGWALRMNNENNRVMWEATGAESEQNGIGWNLQTTWGMLGYGLNGAQSNGGKRIYGASKADFTGRVDGSDKPLQLATGGFEVDEVRVSTNYFGDAWAKETYYSINNKSYCTCGLVSIDCDKYNTDLTTPGLICDWWKTLPSLAKTVWHEDETWPTESKGSYVPTTEGGAGTAITATYRLLPDGEPTTVHPTARGYYRATYDHTDQARYRPQPHVIDFYIIEPAEPSHDLGGLGGDSGRILLMNADSNANYPVTNQGWCAQSDAGVTYWNVLGGGSLSNNVMPGTEFELVRAADTNRLWYLAHCRQGNTFPTNNAETLSTTHCFLPKSSATASAITNESVAATRGSTGWLMMQNTVDAAIYSSCFTNGIGTVYFDAVNDLRSVAGNAEGYQIVLEVATETTDGKVPLDENCWTEPAPGVTNRYGKLEGMWKRVDLAATLISNTTYTDQPVTDCLALKGTPTVSNIESYFYRVHARLDDHRPIRFRIRRVSEDLTAVDSDGNVLADDGYVLMDNLIVSKPQVYAKLEPYGRFDPSLPGDRAVGYGGALSVPFPCAADAPGLTGRARVVLPPNTEYATKSPDEYISLAQMFYRWRYLGAGRDWTAAKMTGVGADRMDTAAALDLPAKEGDVEFYFVSVMKAPFYQYVDYTGLGRRVASGGYSEEVPKYETRLGEEEVRRVGRLASLGEDWFTRIRGVEQRSDYEQASVILSGAIEGEYPMQLLADGKWRAMVMVPTNAEGTCRFQIRGLNRQTAGSTEYEENATFWSGGAKELELPANGVLTADGALSSFTVDHVANYLEFKARIDGDEPIWSVTRAEYQNFNNWNDVWSSPLDQRFAVGTNGVDDVAMRTENLDTSSWTPYPFENDAWNETFYLVNYNDPGFPKETYYQNHATPSAWSGYNLTFVSKNLVGWIDPTKVDNSSGMAAKLRGQGAGILEYAKSNGPKGIERIDLTARIGQSLTFDDVTYWARAFFPFKSNYTFVCPVSMSRAIPKDTEAGDMSVGAAVSVFAYYFEGVGAYEFRVTRAASGAEVLLELFKWHVKNGTMGFTRLCGQRYNSGGNDTLKPWDSSGEVQSGFYGLFISVQNNVGGGTKIIGGLGHTAKTDLSSTFEGSAVEGYGGLVYTDKSSPLTYGAYGVGAKDCPAQFMRPRHYDAPMTASITGLGNTSTYAGGQWYKPGGGKSIAFGPELIDDTQDLDDGYLVKKGPLEVWTNKVTSATADTHHGLRTPVDQKQRVVVQLRPKNGKEWTEVGSREVSGYALQSYTIPLYLSGDFDLRVTTPEDSATDVVVGEVRQRQWQGADYERINGDSADEYVYTQGCVLSNALRQTKDVLLQPARGLATKPLSVRSPVLDGLGKVSFAYEDADPAAEIWVQVATNHVENNLYGTGGYNFSTESVERGGAQVVPKWMTVAKYGAGEDCSEGLGVHGVKTVYLGWHDQAGKPVKGLFRVFVPPAVVEKATVLATNATHQVDYGRITVTGMTVTDEPGVSEYSWRGWNLRTAGEGTDAEGRMFLDDGVLANDVGYGLVCALNNSVNDLREGSDETVAASRNPAIWSPTLSRADGKRRSIGSVSLKARLYYANDERETAEGGKVTVWGTTADSTAENWTKVAEFEVTSSTFSNFTWAANGVAFRAVKLEISDPKARTRTPATDRVVIDEVTVCEKVQPTIDFVYARPFRTDLFEPVEVANILSPEQQPLVGESWGVQAKLSLSQMEEEVSDIKVYLTYYVGKSPWGYDKWKAIGSTPVRLEEVGEPGSHVYRSLATGPDTIVPPVAEPGTVVQYMLFVRYTSDTGASEERPMETWEQPTWYWPKDFNAENGGYSDPSKFSAYTILDSVSPGRAWINEVNWNDGPKEDTGGELSVTNQFIEICVPSGVDMSRWQLRAVDMNTNVWTMATFGAQMPARKVSAHATNGFEFVVVESPETNYRGGILDPDGFPAADGTWASDGPNGSAKNGTLNYSFPWQFELVRPSGVIEHQVVLQGTNEWTEYSFGDRYYGTNLLARLNANDRSPKRFYAAEETAKRRDGSAFGSAGVQGGSADGNPAPGADGTWANGLRFTAGRLNEGQIIPKGWFIAPSGTNAWIYLSLDGDHLSQSIGGDTSRQTMVIVPQGVETNVTYTADPWYETATITMRDDTGTRTVDWHRRGVSDFRFSATGVTYLVAHEGLDSGLGKFNIGFGPDNSKYSRAVVNWLMKNWPDATSEDIRLAHYMNLVNESVVTNLTLTEMYWFDIPPVNSEGNESDESEWWLRAGFTGIRPQAYHRKGYNGIIYTNSQFDVKMYVSNSWDNVTVYAPPRLQGLANERSDDPSTYSGGWTSVTFKIRGALINGEPGNKGFLPFRMFTFGPGSFSDATDDPPFTSTIEILDPFSRSSPGFSYGWCNYPNTTPFWFKWCIDTDGVPDTVQVLKREDVYHDVE